MLILIGQASDKISTFRYTLFLGPNPISCSSRKQQSVARFSIEVEYKSVANVLSEITWVQNLLDELRYHISQMCTIFCDNIGVSYLSKNQIFDTKMKHIAVDFHSDRVVVKYLPSWIKLQTFSSSHFPRLPFFTIYPSWLLWHDT